MNITSSFFLFLFLPCVLVSYVFAGKQRLRNGVLLAASLVFYAWGDPNNIVLLLCLSVVNYILSNVQSEASKAAKKKILLLIAVAVNVLILVYYKYLRFFSFLVPAFLQNDTAYFSTIVQPLGLSFFIFKNISYHVDVYRNHELGRRGFWKFLFYVSFFPQILSGPITRFSPINDQLSQRQVTKKCIMDGVERIVLGLFKKLVISNPLAVLANSAYALTDLTMPMAWIGAVAFTLQLYFDFSGYSDIAIGLGNLFGFETPENFRYPYISMSVQEFWRRWHISLSSWFRDYVYIPLGGSRCSLVRTSINTLIVFALTGLWHGADWSFVIWGLYYAVFLILERTALKSLLPKFPKVLRWLYAFLVINIGWVFFRAASISDAFIYIQAMFGSAVGGWQQVVQYLTTEHLFCMVIGLMFSFPVWPQIKSWLTQKAPYVVTLGLSLCFLVAVCYMAGSDFSPFLYVQF